MNALSVICSFTKGRTKSQRRQKIAYALQAGDLESLEEFEALFKGAKFHKGLEMVFTNTQTGALALRIQDEEVRWCTSASQHNLTMNRPPH